MNRRILPRDAGVLVLVFSLLWTADCATVKAKVEPLVIQGAALVQDTVGTVVKSPKEALNVLAKIVAKAIASVVQSPASITKNLPTIVLASEAVKKGLELYGKLTKTDVGRQLAAVNQVLAILNNVQSAPLQLVENRLHVVSALEKVLREIGGAPPAVQPAAPPAVQPAAPPAAPAPLAATPASVPASPPTTAPTGAIPASGTVSPTTGLLVPARIVPGSELARAASEFEQGRYREAESLARQALAVDPSSSEARTIAANSRIQLAPAEVKSLIDQYVLSLRVNQAGEFYRLHARPAVLERVRNNPDEAGTDYSDVQASASDIRLAFQEMSAPPFRVQVKFSLLLVGTSRWEGVRKVIFEGVRVWTLERTDGEWVISEIGG